MCAATAAVQRGSPTSSGSSVRTRFVIDPIWKVVDAESYKRTWEILTKEAKRYGFLGFDLEWTTKLVDPDAEDDTATPTVQSVASPTKRKPRRWTGPVATMQLSTCSCTMVVRWNHLHALVSGNASDLLQDPYAAISSGWPSYRLGQKHNCRELLRQIYVNIKALINDTDVFLVGVGVHGDEVKLHRDYPKLVPKLAAELTALAEACLPDVVVDKSLVSSGGDAQKVRTDSLQSLKKLSAALTGRVLGKDMCVVMSDWGGCHGALTPLQIEYSAEDAEASYDVCVAILKGGGFLRDTPQAGREAGEQADAAPWCVADGLDCREVLACCSTSATGSVRKDSPAVESRATTTNGAAAQPASSTNAAAGAENVTEVDWCKGRSKPYYDNISVYSPDMQLVFTVDKAKADWYVNKKELATVVEWRLPGSPASYAEDKERDVVVGEEREMAAIQLKFAPDFARYNDAHIRRNLEYFKQPKENICVVCGESGALVRFAVVPLMYRRFFPSVYMSHNSYDLLLLCPHCFAKSRRLYDQLRLTVASDFGIPLVHLRGAQRDAYAEQVRSTADQIDALTRAYEACHDGEATERDDAPAIDCDLHPRLRLQGMRDYLALMEHREVLDKVFSYAKALYAHYQTLHQPTEAGDTRREDEGVAAAAHPSPSPPPISKKARRHGGHANGCRPDKVTAIPEERRQMMAEFLCTHAPLYPFYREHTTDTAEERQRTPEAASYGLPREQINGSALQHAVFCDVQDGPATPDGVTFILTGALNEKWVPCDADSGNNHNASTTRECGGAPIVLPCSNTSRGVLTRYWVSTHPELVSALPTVTRAEERLRMTGTDGELERIEGGTQSCDSPAVDSPSEGDTADVPYVDSHAFLVLQLLLRKYEGALCSRKTAEHAVGQFIYRWRSAFVDGMKPRFLPRGWVPEDGILR